jgi:phage shock protein E
MNVEQIIKEKKGTVVDVRTPDEFRGGNVVGSINIPLQEITERIIDLQNLEGPIVLCCASGNRSGQAHRYLEMQGIVCVNGGSWLDVNYIQSQNI